MPVVQVAVAMFKIIRDDANQSLPRITSFVKFGIQKNLCVLFPPGQVIVVVTNSVAFVEPEASDTLMSVFSTLQFMYLHIAMALLPKILKLAPVSMSATKSTPQIFTFMRGSVFLRTTRSWGESSSQSGSWFFGVDFSCPLLRLLFFLLGSAVALALLVLHAAQPSLMRFPIYSDSNSFHGGSAV